MKNDRYFEYINEGPLTLEYVSIDNETNPNPESTHGFCDLIIIIKIDFFTLMSLSLYQLESRIHWPTF